MQDDVNTHAFCTCSKVLFSLDAAHIYIYQIDLYLLKPESLIYLYVQGRS